MCGEGRKRIENGNYGVIQRHISGKIETIRLSWEVPHLTYLLRKVKELRGNKCPICNENSNNTCSIKMSSSKWRAGGRIVTKVLVTQVWEPKFESPSPMIKKRACFHLICDSCIGESGRQRQEIQSSLVNQTKKMVSSGFNERYYLKNIKYTSVEDDITYGPLASTFMFTHMLIQPHVHVKRYIHTKMNVWIDTFPVLWHTL